MVGADRPKDQFAQDSSGGAVKDDDVIGLGLEHGDALPFPVRADADLALAVMDASRGRHHPVPVPVLRRRGRGIAGADLGQRRVDLGGQRLTQTLVRPLMVVVPPESVAQRLALVDGVGRVGVEVLEGAVVALEVAAGLRLSVS